MRTLFLILFLSAIWVFQVQGQTLWDNGDTDGSSTAVQSGEDPYRSILEDFEIPLDRTWTITEFRTIGIWQNGGPNQGSGYELTLWSHEPDLDGGRGGPSGRLSSLLTSNYHEEVTGRNFFNRPEVEVTVDIDPFVLPTGRYWIEMHMLGPEGGNFNQLAVPRDSILLSPSWIYYEDFPPTPQPGAAFFGSDLGTSFQLKGTSLPEASSLTLLTAFGIAILNLRRR